MSLFFSERVSAFRESEYLGEYVKFLLFIEFIIGIPMLWEDGELIEF